MQLEDFIVEDRNGEECDGCGWTGYPGESYMSIDMDTGKVYCSATCAKKDLPVLQDNKPYFDLA